MTDEQLKRLKEECQRLRDELMDGYGEKVFYHELKPYPRVGGSLFSLLKTKLDLDIQRKIRHKGNDRGLYEENVGSNEYRNEMDLIAEMLRLFGGKEWEFLRG